MVHSLRNSRAALLIVGVLVGVLLGVLLGGLLPHAPLHAVATDRQDNFAICTGPLDEELEGIFFLDFLSGELKCAALSTQTGKFNAIFHRNILQDLGADPSKNPRYLMVTGVANLRRTGGTNVRPSNCVVYIAEVTSGKVAAYSVPWVSRTNNNAPIAAALLPLDMMTFRTSVVRGE